MFLEKAFLSFQNNISLSRPKGRLNTTDCYRFCVSFHLFPDAIIYGQKFRGGISQQKMFLKLNHLSKTLICYFKNNKTRLMLESSCDPVKLQNGNDFEAVYKCESATIRMVRRGRAKSRLGSKGDPIDKQKLSSILGKYSGFEKSGKQIWTLIAREYFGTNHINRKKRMQLYNFLDPASTK